MSKWLIFFMLTLCGCTDLITGEGDLNPVLDKINTMSLDIVTLQIDVLQLERDILTELGLARKYLTNDLMSNLVPNYIHKQVQSAVADIFKSRSVKDIVSDHLGQKITYLTGNVHQLKRRFELTTDEFEDRSRDWRTHIESLDKRMKKLNSKVSALDNLGNMNVRHEEFFEKIFQLKSEMWSNMSRIQKDVYDKIQFQAEVSSNMTKKQDLLYRNIQHINEEVSINRQTLAAMSEVNKQLKQQNQQLLAKVHSHNGLNSKMAWLFALPFSFLSWKSINALDIGVHIQIQAGQLICNETYHDAGMVKSVMYDIKHLSCIRETTTQESSTGLEPRMITFKNVSMCTSVWGQSLYAVTWCRQTTCKLHRTSNELDEAQTEITIYEQESTEDISQTETPAPFQHIKNMTLHQACEEGRLDEVKYILSTGLEDINCRNEKDFTPVLSAAWKGQEAVFDFLVSRDCDLSLVNNVGNNALHIASEGGSADIVVKLIEKNIFDIDCQGGFGWIPVMFAAYCGNIGVVDLLLRKGCTVTAVDARNDTLLHIACLGGYVDVVKYIITHTLISIESRANHGLTPVLSAAELGHVEVVTLLQSKGCHMTATNDWKMNILHIACSGGKVDMVKHILNSKIVGIDSKEGTGQTPVMMAAQKGHVVVVTLLESMGCLIRETDVWKRNILHISCLGGHVDMVKYVLSRKIVDIDSKNVMGETPVMIATKNGHINIVDLLEMKGCNLRAVAVDGNNLLHAACFGGHVDMVQHILMQKIISIESRGIYGKTGALIAAEHGHRRVVDLLRR